MTVYSGAESNGVVTCTLLAVNGQLPVLCLLWTDSYLYFVDSERTFTCTLFAVSGQLPVLCWLWTDSYLYFVDSERTVTCTVLQWPDSYLYLVDSEGTVTCILVALNGQLPVLCWQWMDSYHTDLPPHPRQSRSGRGCLLLDSCPPHSEVLQEIHYSVNQCMIGC